MPKFTLITFVRLNSSDFGDLLIYFVIRLNLAGSANTLRWCFRKKVKLALIYISVQKNTPKAYIWMNVDCHFIKFCLSKPRTIIEICVWTRLVFHKNF